MDYSKITAIYKIYLKDLILLSHEDYNCYFCIDQNMVYVDVPGETNHSIISDITIVYTELDRLNLTGETVSGLVYCVENNSLWNLNNNEWTLYVGEIVSRSSGYTVATGSIKRTTDSDKVIDNNGLLRDGSVVIRDANRVIKGKLYIDNENNLVISSFLGGGFKFLPNGDESALGAFSYDGDGNYKVITWDNKAGETVEATLINTNNVEEILDNLGYVKREDLD